MPTPLRLALAAWGDPFDASTWSGTSVNLASALQAMQVEIIGLNCRPSQSKTALHLASSRLSGQDIAFTRSQLSRQRCISLAQGLPDGCAGVLHMSSVTIPPRGSTPGVRHFLLCDSMNDYWERYSTDRDVVTARQWQRREADERVAVAGTEHFFPISQHAASSLRDHYGVSNTSITVVGTGRGKIAPLQGDKDYTRKNLLMVAKLRFEDKGGPLLIQALQIARKTDPQLHLTLVSPENFRPLAESAPGVLPAGVTLTGRVEWSELQRLFDEACLYAMPALREPWGLVYAEALATKTPVFGLNRAALPELSGHGQFGFLVDEATPEAVAQALLKAVADPQKLQAMGEAGQRYCLENFSWERTASRIFDRIFGAAT